MVTEKLQNKIYTLLRKSEKYVKTDMIYLTKGGSWLLMGQFIAIVSGLGLSVAFANLVPKDVFGNYKFILSVTSIIGAFALTGMGNAVTQAVARGYDGTLKNAFRTQTKWSVFLTLLSFGVAVYYFLKGNTDFGYTFLIAGVFLPIIASSSLYDPFLYGKKLFKESVLYNIVRNITPPLLMVGTLLMTVDIPVILFVYFASTALPTLIIYLIVSKKFQTSTKVAKDTIKYGKHLSFMNVLSTIASQLDKVLIFYFLGAVQLAIYAFAISLPNQLQNVNKIFNPLLLPKLSTKTLQELQKTIHHKAIIAFLFGSAVFLLYFFTAPFIFNLLFSQYSESVIFSQLFALILVFMPANIYSQCLISQNSVKQLYIARTATPIVRIISLAILLPLYGIWGAIFAILITRTINTVLHIILFYRLKPQGV